MFATFLRSNNKYRPYDTTECFIVEETSYAPDKQYATIHYLPTSTKNLAIGCNPTTFIRSYSHTDI